MRLTIGEIRKAIAALPDEAVVLVWDKDTCHAATSYYYEKDGDLHLYIKGAAATREMRRRSRATDTSVDGVAKLLGVNGDTLRRLDRAGVVKPGRDYKGHRVYSAADIEKLKRHFNKEVK